MRNKLATAYLLIPTLIIAFSTPSLAQSTGTTPVYTGNNPATGTQFPTYTPPTVNFLPQWNVNNTGSTFNSNSSSTSYYGNGSYGSGYPSVSDCGLSFNAGIVGGRGGINSNSSSTDLSNQGYLAQIGLRYSMQECPDYKKLEEIRQQGESNKAREARKQAVEVRCVEAFAEAGKDGKKINQDLIDYCKKIRDE